MVPPTAGADNRFQSDPMTLLLAQIDTLLAAPTPASSRSSRELDRVERTLTDGYAHALGLEAERCRLNRRLREAAVELLDHRDAAKASEICGLARRLATVDGDLLHLRERLSLLRVRAQALRA